MTKIDAKYLTKIYKSGDYGLKNCSFSTKNGEFLVVLGASGSGKSTLLKVLAGTEQLSCGELYFDGMLSEGIPRTKRDVSMAFQEYVLYPHMTVFENLATPLRIAGEDEKSIYDRVMQALAVFGLSAAADVKPKFLSGGEQQRASLAKTLLKRSKLVLLDEPMSSVDEKSRWDYCLSLKKMKQMLPDSTFIYVTHNTKEALFLADRIAIMDDGAIIELAPRDFMIKHPEHLVSMEIMGAAKNVARIEIDGEDSQLSDLYPDLDLRYIDRSRLNKGDTVFVVQSSLDDDYLHLFDKKGRTLSFSSEILMLDGAIDKNALLLAGQRINLSDEYLSRLLRCPPKVSVELSIEKFSKTLISNGFSLVSEVLWNGGDHVVLSISDRCFVLSKKTDLEPGERIRLYYKIDDLVLYEGEERLTCHYPLHRELEVKLLDARNGRIDILGTRISLGRAISSDGDCLIITDRGISLGYQRGKYSVRVEECLDEEIINNKKLNHIALHGLNRYLSVFSAKDVSCFGKSKVWLNIDPDRLEIKERK